jgi:hypothetical protein
MSVMSTLCTFACSSTKKLNTASYVAEEVKCNTRASRITVKE